MEDVFTLRLAETDSTNRFLREYRGEEGRLMTVAVADYQTAGRGQGRNTWESAPGQNLLFSVKVDPKGLAVRRQFVMLEAGALAVRDALRHYADGFTVKWPNDVYWRAMKISGTLSECTVAKGLVSGCILGIGINVNQREFTGSAPNPVSLASILGREVSRDELLDLFIDGFKSYLGMVDAGRYDDIHAGYAAALYRREGFHAYRDATGEFMAAIERVEPDGRFVLRRADGSESGYLFKEVECVLPTPALPKGGGLVSHN